MQYHSATKSNELVEHTAALMNLRNMLKEIVYKRIHTVLFHLYEILKQTKLIYSDRNQNCGYHC